MTRWVLSWAVLLLVMPASTQLLGSFAGQLGTPDQSLLGDDWYVLTLSEMPALPLAGATVSVLDCEENCPQPVMTDAAGWFEFPGLALETARLRFDPPDCDSDDTECEALEARVEILPNGGRTVLGAKWPAGVEDTILRYLPLVEGAIYIRWKGEIPILRSCGAAGTWTILLAEYCRRDEYLEHSTFVHELMHVYEIRLRNACWNQRLDVGGWILQEDWLSAVSADEIENGLGWVGEYPTEGLDETRRARETLASFAEEYFTPQRIVRKRRARYPSVPIENYKTYKDMETYAPNRYGYFEKIVFQRYLEEKQWRRDNPDGEQWPGLCEAPPFDADEDDSNSGGSVIWPFGSKSSYGHRNQSYTPEDPGPALCSFPDHR